MEQECVIAAFFLGSCTYSLIHPQFNIHTVRATRAHSTCQPMPSLL